MPSEHQRWQHVCVECTLAIYGHTHTVNKYCWASAGSRTCKLSLNLSHLTWFEAEHTPEALEKGALYRSGSETRGTDIYRHALIYSHKDTHPSGTCRPKHMEPHIQSLLDNSLDTAWTWQPNISVRVKNKKGKACCTAVRCWEICVLSANLNHNSWDDKALPLNCLFLFSLLSFTCFFIPLLL